MAEWDPEVEVDEERARVLIGGQVPELAAAPIRRLATGWDNIVYLVDERWVFRFPRRSIAVAGVEREIATLPRLAAHLPLSIPAPRWVGSPADGYPWPWFGAEYLPGVELAGAELADDRRGPVAGALGEFLRHLHAPRLVSRIGAGLPIDPMRRADMPFRVAQVRRRLDRAQAAGLWQPSVDVRQLMAAAQGLPPPSRVVVLHGDLHARHVLVEGERASGVIDWGDVCTGDPSVDLAVAYGAVTGEARDAFRDAYGPMDGLTELRARVIAVFLAAALLEYSVDQGMDALRADSVRSIERAVT